MFLELEVALDEKGTAFAVRLINTDKIFDIKRDDNNIGRTIINLEHKGEVIGVLCKTSYSSIGDKLRRVQGEV